MDTFDYIIAGGGSAGCVLANRLSADPRRRVLLLEAGGRDNYIWVKVPVGYLYCIGNPRTDWCYETGAEPGLNGRKLKYPRGRVLGGSSSINGMIYMRGQAADYDGWRQLGAEGWGWDDVLPYFKRAEDHYGGADEFHGRGGEIRVEKQRLRWEILEAFQRAAQQWGVEPVADFNRGDNEGSSLFDVTQRKGWRWSAADAFLKPIRSRANLQVTVCEARLDGQDVFLLDTDIDEHGELLAHTFDLIRHVFTGGTDPIDVHESLRALFPDATMGYDLEPRAPIGSVRAKVRGATR